MHSALLRWLRDPPEDAGVHIAGPAGSWDRWSYPRLAGLVGAVGRGLTAQGVRRGENVVLVQHGGVEFIAALYGVLAIGAVPSPISPPEAFSDRAGYGDHLANVLATSHPVLLVTQEDLVDVLTASLPPDAAAPKLLAFHDLVASDTGASSEPPQPVPVDPDDLALLTYTSGSSGHCRGVRVPYRALESNVAAIREVCELGPGSGVVTWLPPHHDMGLIGTLIVAVSTGRDLWVMTPTQFVRDPLRYVRCLADGATHSASPTFGLEYIARKVRPAALEGFDLSHVRGLFVGAERVDEAALERFCALLGPHGFRSAAIMPSYGCAEATLAVSSLNVNEQWTSIRVDPASLAEGRRIELVDGAEGHVMVGCGQPVAGMRVEAVGQQDGRVLPEGTAGELVVSGDSVALGYATRTDDAAAGSGGSSAFEAGRLHTGDAGFLYEGQVYVLGRIGDSMKLRGRMLFAEDLEGLLHDAGIPAARAVALLGVLHGRPTAAVLLESVRELTPESTAELAKALRSRLEDAQLTVLKVRTGSILRTSSGKPKRRALWRAFAEGGIAGEELDWRQSR